MTEHLIMYMGQECKHCHEMEPHIERLEKEENIKIKKLEVWHNEENAKKWKEHDAGFCGGVPLFINKKTGKKICGSTSYENLKDWAKGK